MRITDAGKVTIEVVEGGFIIDCRNHWDGSKSGKAVRERLEDALEFAQQRMSGMVDMLGRDSSAVGLVDTYLTSGKKGHTGMTMAYGSGSA